MATGTKQVRQSKPIRRKDGSTYQRRAHTRKVTLADVVADAARSGKRKSKGPSTVVDKAQQRYVKRTTTRTALAAAAVTGAGGLILGAWFLAPAILGGAAWVGISRHRAKQVEVASQSQADALVKQKQGPLTKLVKKQSRKFWEWFKADNKRELQRLSYQIIPGLHSRHKKQWARDKAALAKFKKDQDLQEGWLTEKHDDIYLRQHEIDAALRRGIKPEQMDDLYQAQANDMAEWMEVYGNQEERNQIYNTRRKELKARSAALKAAKKNSKGKKSKGSPGFFDLPVAVKSDGTAAQHAEVVAIAEAPGKGFEGLFDTGFGLLLDDWKLPSASNSTSLV